MRNKATTHWSQEIKRRLDFCAEMKSSLHFLQVRVKNINPTFIKILMTSSIKKWEVTILEFQDKNGIKYKVTRRVPELHLAETKFFSSKEEAKQQFEEWLG